MSDLENKLKETNRLFIFCKIEDVLLDGEGNLHLIISKDSPYLMLDIAKVLKKYFLNKDTTLIFNYLKRNNSE